jgi:hypothetical protein
MPSVPDYVPKSVAKDIKEKMKGRYFCIYTGDNADTIQNWITLSKIECDHDPGVEEKGCSKCLVTPEEYKILCDEIEKLRGG